MPENTQLTSGENLADQDPINIGAESWETPTLQTLQVNVDTLVGFDGSNVIPD